MSLKDFLKGAAQSAGTYVQSQCESLQEYKDKYESLSDEQLLRKFKSSSGTRRTACLLLLKERGVHPKN